MRQRGARSSTAPPNSPQSQRRRSPRAPFAAGGLPDPPPPVTALRWGHETAAALRPGMYPNAMDRAPDWYSHWRASLDFDRIDYNVGGIELFQPENLPEAQLGYAVGIGGESLVGVKPGGWLADWVVIGNETACGDPVFASQTSPHPIFTAMHGQGSWEPELIAPSLETFRECLDVFRRFAEGRSCPGELKAHLPSEEERARFLTDIKRLTTTDDVEAWFFWAVQIETDPDSLADL